MTEIVKVQRPLMTNGEDPQWLIYGKGRTNMQVVSESQIPDKVKTAMRTSFKAYFRASWTPGGWSLGAQVKDRNW